MPELITYRQGLAKIVADEWQTLAGDDPVPAHGKFILPLERWLAERDNLADRSDPLGVQLSGADDLQQIVPDLDRLAVIALEFPKFTDGRSYSHARLLRERHGYQGEIRAVGDVLRDQLFYMARVGFDAFALRADRSAEDALDAFNDFQVRYQAAADEAQPLFRRRA